VTRVRAGWAAVCPWCAGGIGRGAMVERDAVGRFWHLHCWARFMLPTGAAPTGAR
jgi:hypothetical protein